MSKTVSSFELTLNSRPQHQTLTSWLYGELRLAILEGRLVPGSRLPASRDFASQYGLSRGTVVSVLERLQAEGYVSCRVGFGTWVNHVAAASPTRQVTSTPPAYIRRVISAYVRPKPFVDLAFHRGRPPVSRGESGRRRIPIRALGTYLGRPRKKLQFMVEDRG